MARHLCHQNDISLLLSHHQLVSPQRPHTDVSLLPATLPAVVSPAPSELTLLAAQPRIREVPHLHIQATKQ